MLFKKFWKQQSNKEELPSLIDPFEGLRVIHGYCFMAIGQHDPDPIANKVRILCDEFHNENSDYEFHLIDEKRMEIIYYGHGEKRNVRLKSEIDLRMASALRTLNEAPNRSKKWSIREPYDYAWIKKVIDYALVPGLSKLKFGTTRSFITYLQQNIGIEGIESRYKSTFNKYCKEVDNRTIPFIYKHHNTGVMIDTTETDRRNAIVMKFIGLMI
jgi:hypothetical protein